jgi:hypothetical protein
VTFCNQPAPAASPLLLSPFSPQQVQAWYRQKGYTVQHKNAQKGFLIVSPKSQAGASAAASGVTPLATPASGVQYALPLDPNTRFTLPTAAATPSAAVSAGAAASAASDDVSAASASVAAAAAPAQASAGACPVILNPMPYPEDQGSCTRGKECTNWGVQSVAAATPEMQAIATAGKDDVLHCLLSSGVDITHPDLAGMKLRCYMSSCAVFQTTVLMVSCAWSQSCPPVTITAGLQSGSFEEILCSCNGLIVLHCAFITSLSNVDYVFILGG